MYFGFMLDLPSKLAKRVDQSTNYYQRTNNFLSFYLVFLINYYDTRRAIHLVGLHVNRLNQSFKMRDVVSYFQPQFPALIRTCSFHAGRRQIDHEQNVENVVKFLNWLYCCWYHWLFILKETTYLYGPAVPRLRLVLGRIVSWRGLIRSQTDCAVATIYFSFVR